MTTDTDDQDLHDEIRAYLERRAEQGNSYVKCKWIGNELDVTSQTVAHRLDPFLDDGTLEIYYDANVATVYEITLDLDLDYDRDRDRDQQHTHDQ